MNQRDAFLSRWCGAGSPFGSVPLVFDVEFAESVDALLAESNKELQEKVASIEKSLEMARIQHNCDAAAIRYTEREYLRMLEKRTTLETFKIIATNHHPELEYEWRRIERSTMEHARLHGDTKEDGS